MRINTSTWVAIASTGIAALLYVLGSTGESTEGYEFPNLIAVAMFVLAVVLLIQELSAARTSGGLEGVEKEEEIGAIPWGRLWPGLLIILAYMLLAERLGFLTTSFLAFFSIAALYAPGDLSPHSFLKPGLIAVAFMVALYSVFVLLLQVQLPKGILF
jgi:hypothetical protein